MAKQSIVWTVLPNGMGVNEKEEEVFQLSVFVSPRLQAEVPSEDRLTAFPDFRNWTERMRSLRFSIEFSSGNSVVKTIADLPPRNLLTDADDALWQALFKPQTFIRSHSVDSYSNRRIRSYSVSDLYRGLQGIYENHSRSLTITEGWDHLGKDANHLKDWIPFEVADFHAPAAATSLSLLQSQDLSNYIDFHQALASLSDYPYLLRRLGIIFDLQVIQTELPLQLLDLSVRVIPKWQSDLPANKNIAILPRTTFDRLGFANSTKNEISSGYLSLNTTQQNAYRLIDIDIEGAIAKFDILTDQVLAGSRTPIGLPVLRSAGISLIRQNRAQLVQADFKRADELNGPNNPQLLFAEDLTRGYRIDVWSSLTQKWHSLCDRIGTYSFEEPIPSPDIQDDKIIIPDIQDEGYVQMSLTQKTVDANADLYLHESLFRWEGWSLCVPRPGQSIADPELSANADTSNDPITPFKLRTTFVPLKGSLPKLRFGASYRLRARAVDLAGNSRLVQESANFAGLPRKANEFIYRRFEPIDAPVLVLRAPLDEHKNAGESLERLVIRSFNDYDPANPNQDDRREVDATQTPEICERHIAPPRTSQLMAETHGMFDQANGGLKPGSYDLIAEKSGDFNTAAAVSDGSPTDGLVAGKKLVLPIEPDPQIHQLPYLPDPLSRGAALRNLPATAADTVGQVTANGNLEYRQLLNAEDRSDSVTMIPFDFQDEWHSAQPFRIILMEGTAAPQWNREQRTLTVALPKAEMTTIRLSSYVQQEDLKLMGIWNWLQERIDQELTSNNSPEELKQLTAEISRLAQAAIEGNHWMITPPKELVLVHAVQQPLAAPVLSIQALRTLGSTSASIAGFLEVHRQSTAKIELVASWQDFVDLDAEPEPRWIPAQVTACELPLSDLNQAQIQDASGKKLGSYILRSERYIPEFGNYIPKYDLIGFNNMLGFPVQGFGDTKHRVVRYKAIATSRFREYFDRNSQSPLNFCRESEEVTLNIPATARPAAPKILYVIPTFRWTRQTATNIKTSQRLGQGVRIYLERPWFSSGEGEQLAVIFALKDLTDNTQERDRLSPYITQWGADPIWLSDNTLPSTATSNFSPSSPVEAASVGRFFPRKKQLTGGLSLEEVPTDQFIAVGHEVKYDRDRRLWYCDIEIDCGESYFPFVRLALARYQPNAVAKAELSRVVLADFVQLAPDRSAILTYDPYDADKLTISISGLTYKAIADLEGKREEGGSTIEVHLEQRRPEIEGDLSWTSVKQIAEQKALKDGHLLWRGTVTLPSDRQPQDYRLVFKEFEMLYADGQPPVKTKRLVYADSFEL